MTGEPPTIRRPDEERIRALGRAHHFGLTDEEVGHIAGAIDDALDSFERLDEIPDPPRERRYTDRDPGYRPGPDEDPYNAFVTRCRVAGAEDGPLAGLSVGLKDNVSLAGVEMTCGSRLLEGYVPTRDATIVTRLLDAGATVTGKLSMEDLAYSGSGGTAAFGPVLNPRNPDHLAGGSSGGSAAAVVAGDVDVAIGADQGGSVRIPASFCGCVGHKPTWGLVPYTGIVGVDPTIDHAGPIGRTVEDCALVLEVIAGEDPGDPRQGPVGVPAYTDLLTLDPADLTVGVLEEGFEGNDEPVNERVRAALDRFEAAGAEVRSVSVPWHRDGGALNVALGVEAMAGIFGASGLARYSKGEYDVDFAEAFGKALRVRGDDLPITMKYGLVLGQYLTEQYRGRYYARAQNLRRELAAAYDDALDEVDVLALPTLPRTALERRPDCSGAEIIERALTLSDHTAPFNVSGHPATSVPCGTDGDDLPVGLSFVGGRFADADALGAAAAFEASVDWTER